MTSTDAQSVIHSFVYHSLIHHSRSGRSRGKAIISDSILQTQAWSATCQFPQPLFAFQHELVQAAMPNAKVTKSVAKKGMKKKEPRFKHFSTVENECLRRLQKKGKSPAQVAELMDRDLSSVNRHFKTNKATTKTRKPVGRPPALTEKQIDRVVDTTERLTQAAGRSRTPYQVTASMVRSALRLNCKDRVVLDALHSRGITSHKMREKPIRTDEDAAGRLQFGKDNADKPAAFWTSGVHAYLDNKFFPAYLTGAARTYAAKRAVHRTFRKSGQGLAKGHVRPRKATSGAFASQSVLVGVAISAKKVIMCHVVDGKWNGAAAAKMYSRSLAPALRKAYPSKNRFLLLEDNDPSGYKSKVAKQAKRDGKVDVFELPKRSPDLNPLDYGFWDAVNRRLRRQEKRFAAGKKESRKQFVARLRRTTLRMPPQVLAPLVESMKRRCAAVKAAKGENFEE